MDIMIWGCGRFGKQAYYYYNENEELNIVGFIDSNPDVWGTSLFGKTIYSPKVLENFSGRVVIAVKNDYASIQKVLEKTYGISETVLFGVEEQPLIAQEYSDVCGSVDKNTIMIYFMGGLGNQMFQYALAKNYLLQGKNIVANIEHYFKLGNRKFILCDVFKNIALNFGGEIQKNEIVDKNADVYGNYKNFRIYVEDMGNDMEKSTDMSLLDITGGVIYGYFQNFHYAQRIESELCRDFEFGTNDDDKLINVLKMIQKKNCVSVHIRRGDYITKRNQDVYGGICTPQYYDNAMKMMKDKVASCVFCFFSNDIEWVKEHFKIPDALYIESNMFEDYQDWYDMYLMSQCKHNIIANSTFSWWGAWLNGNPEKIVIAPKKWLNLRNCRDICPDDWFRM